MQMRNDSKYSHIPSRELITKILDYLCTGLSTFATIKTVDNVLPRPYNGISNLSIVLSVSNFLRFDIPLFYKR